MHPIPLSALHGDNVIGPSARTPWFEGQALLPYLETVEVERERAWCRFGCPVQLVSRPDHSFRGYAGQIVSGRVAHRRPADDLPLRRHRVWPQRISDSSMATRTREAFAPMSGDARARPGSRRQPGRRAGRWPRFSGRQPHRGGRRVDGRTAPQSEPDVSDQHNARTVAAEVDRGLTLNGIGRAVSYTTNPARCSSIRTPDRTARPGSFTS